MHSKTKQKIVSITIPLVLGGISAYITRNGMQTFDLLNKPPLTPPDIVFPIVWTILYTLMGISSYLIYSSQKNPDNIENALWLYSLQLFVNFLWPIFFFNLRLYLFSFVWLIILCIIVLSTILKFYKLNKTAAYLLIPYILWLIFAAYLNYGVYTLN